MKGHTQQAQSGSNESETHQNALGRTEVDGGEAIRCGRVAFTLSVHLWPRVGLNLYRPVRPFDADSPLLPMLRVGGEASRFSSITYRPGLVAPIAGKIALKVSTTIDSCPSREIMYMGGVREKKLSRLAERDTAAAEVRSATPNRFLHLFVRPNPSQNWDFFR
jgi:hypothetical protein